MLATVVVLLAGCATPPQKEYVYVKPPKVELPVRPQLPLETLPEDATEEELDAATWGSLFILEGYSSSLEELLKPYSK